MRAEAVRAPGHLARTGRVADRRRGVAALLGAITSGLSVRRDVRALRERFETALGALLTAKVVALRDDGPAPGAGAGLITVPVPTVPGGCRPRLEVVFDPGVTPDDWSYQLLDAAAHIGALLLEIERAQGYGARRAPRPSDAAMPLIGSSAAIREVRDRIQRVAPTDFTVVIEGESGSGKELVARQIHELSPRRRGPFVAVNCAAIVETLLEAELFGIEDGTATGVRGRRGKFEVAHEGTLFLDEVSDLSAGAQAKLLRAIQDFTIERVGGGIARRIDTRIVVATNKPLPAMVEQGRFRLDLFYRLSGIEVQVPPLRARREDILELARYFLDRHRAFKPLEMSTAAADALVAYDWPGNVRELERVIERVVALVGSHRVELEDLPPGLLGGYVTALVPSVKAHDTMRAWGSRYARLVLERCGNNKRRASRELGISYHTLQAYLKYRPDSVRGN
jgi:transcriptional regulator with PAS, ATPase and Fis domain